MSLQPSPFPPIPEPAAPRAPRDGDADEEPAGGEARGVRLRARGELSRAAYSVESPYDAAARYCNRRSVAWVGYMVHPSETCADGLPRLVTHVDATPAGVYEATRGGAGFAPDAFRVD